MNDLERFSTFAQSIAYEAGRLTVGYFNRTLEVIGKADGSPVTVADREAEKLIRDAIEEKFPEHGIHGEEYGVKEPKGTSYTWYIDPIDGTKSFIHGAPLYTNLLALVRDGKPVLGIINLPALDQLLFASEGKGAWLNGRRVGVSKVSNPSKAVVLTTDHVKLIERPPHKGGITITEEAKFSRTWGDAYGHFLVASGRAEVMLDPEVSPYDIAPFPVIMKEAGGHFFNWNGDCSLEGGNGISCNEGLKKYVDEKIGLRS